MATAHIRENGLALMIRPVEINTYHEIGRMITIGKIPERLKIFLSLSGPFLPEEHKETFWIDDGCYHRPQNETLCFVNDFYLEYYLNNLCKISNHLIIVPDTQFVHVIIFLSFPRCEAISY